MLFAACLSIISGSAAAAKISIIIDDLGNHYREDLRVARLPGAVTCSILPSTAFSVAIAEQCHAQHKTVMLHAPMQAITHQSLGPGALTAAMSKEQFMAILERDIAAIPYVAGVNNHMGSLLTQRAASMRWTMQVLKARQLFFVDSRTSKDSVAKAIAKNFAIPTAKRDVFLDNIPRYDIIDRQFKTLINIAQHKGYAIAIGHPYPATVAYLEQHLPYLAEQGITLVSVAELIH